MKKVLSLMLVIIMAISSFAFAIPASADTPTDAIAIKNAAGFMNIKNNLAGNYYLTNDIDFEGVEFETYVIPGNFAGTIDGNGYTVKNVKFKKATGQNGFFYTLEGATLKNIKFGSQDSLISVVASGFAKWNYFGLIAAQTLTTTSTLDNVHVYADLDINTSVTIGGAGGFFGRIGNDNSPICPVVMTNCSMNGSIDINLNGMTAGEARIGGFSGRIAVGMLSMSSCVNNANISVQNCGTTLSVGGVVGSTPRALRLDYCTNNGNITLSNISGATQCGGFAGTSNPTSTDQDTRLNSCTNNGTVDVQMTSGATAVSSAAGLIGQHKDGNISIKYCSSTELSAATNTTHKNIFVNDIGSTQSTIVERVVVDKDTDGYNLIKTAEDFKNIIAIGYDANFRLANDIDFENEIFDTYIVDDVFKGTIDGADYAIKNFSFLAEEGKVAIFKQLQDATISDLKVGEENAPIEYELTAYACGDGNYRKGLFAQETAETGTVTLDNVTVWGTMDITITQDGAPNGPIGGFIGLAQGNLVFSDCTLNGSITVKDAAELVTDERYKHVGAFFGQVYAREGRSTSLTLTSCTNNADITVENSCKEAYVGSLAGHFENAKGTITGFTNTGDITLEVAQGTSCLGAYIGHVSGTAKELSELITLTSCSNSGTVTGPEAQPEIGKVELTAPVLPPVDNDDDNNQEDNKEPSTKPSTPSINKPSSGDEAPEAAPDTETEHAEEAKAEEAETEERKGCKSSFAGSAAVILSTIVFACVLMKKKKETN